MDTEKIVKIERLAMQIFDEGRLEQGLSEDALGQLVYPDDPNPRMKIQALRIKRGHGKPQRLRLGDFWAICEALGRDPAEVCSEIKFVKLKQADKSEGKESADD